MKHEKKAGKLLYYVASPYTNSLSEIENDRWAATARFVGELTKRGINAISPVVHSHPVKEVSNLKGTFETWGEFNLNLLKRCDALIVYAIAGWAVSKGVKAEIRFAQKINIPIYHIFSIEGLKNLKAS
jgi:hypothetical protein